MLPRNFSKSIPTNPKKYLNLTILLICTLVATFSPVLEIAVPLAFFGWCHLLRKRSVFSLKGLSKG